MLRFLKIRHLAVIDTVEVEFEPGLNVLTGETGAGKSILVEAVSLLLGGRASGDLVRTGEEAATVEAIFENAGEELLVRREITAQGRSRAFVNGTLATAGALKDLSSSLIELHGQHEHQTLLDAAIHLDILDTFGDLTASRDSVRLAFESVGAARIELHRLTSARQERESRLELITFQLAELDRAQLKTAAPGESSEDADLAALRKVLASAERIKRLCAESYAELYEQDARSSKGLRRRLAAGQRAGDDDERFRTYVDARDGIKSQLEDLATFLRRYADGIEASPARLQEVEERLALLERLKRKHGPTLADVITKRDALRLESADLARGDERIEELGREHAAARTKYLAEAGRLSRERRRASEVFAKALEDELAALAMERTRFEVRFGDALAESEWTAEGIDRAEFYVSPNPGEELRPLARIVSGGELSRIMLAIKTLMATSRHGFSESTKRPPSAAAPGLIFDEVDAGIGGRVADVVGRKLRLLGSAFQVLCITHLPQIAAYADSHFQIDKQVGRGRTSTTVRRLALDERVDEVARMLGGEAISDGIRRSAREMLEERAAPASPRPKRKGESERAKAKGKRTT
jgi:DNA repair protein RecN (Recombination protein N)